EDLERLVETSLDEIARRRPHDLADRERRVDVQFSGDEGLVARLVRLGVNAFGKRDVQRNVKRVTRMGVRAFGDGGDFGARPAERLRGHGDLATTEDTEHTEENPKKNRPPCPPCPPW